MEFDLVIKNGVVATAADVGEYDIGVKDGKIALLAPSIDASKATRVIDAEGELLRLQLAVNSTDRALQVEWYAQLRRRDDAC